MSIYLLRYIEPCLWVLASGFKRDSSDVRNLREGHSQVGSLAGAAHLLNDNTGVLREAQ